ASLIPLAKALHNGNEAYYLMNSAYTNDPSKLDVTTSDTSAQVTLGDGSDNQHRFVRVTRPDIKNRVTMYQKHSINFPNETHCEALIDDDQANWLCRDALKGTLVGSRAGYNAYSMSEDWVGTLAKKYINTNGLTFTDGDVCIATAGYSCRNRGSTRAVFKNAKCVVESGSYSCSGETTSYLEGSACIGKAPGACGAATYDHSYCVGDSAWGCCGTACRGGTYNNYSVCYAVRKDACTGNYDPTSCCVGDTYCPEGKKCSENPYWVGREVPDMPTYP
ncbi:MAG: hypothetical protein IKW71_03285, partial [Elusimicrobiaceae bacterium]|nr:hypothetical protein [Elusimicrobiaceae bacterium]